MQLRGISVTIQLSAAPTLSCGDMQLSESIISCSCFRSRSPIHPTLPYFHTSTLSHFHTSTLSLPLIHYHFTTRPHSSFTVSTLSLAHLSSCVYTRERGMDGSKSRVLRALEAAKTKFVKHHEPGFQHMRNFTTNSNNFRENASGGSRSMTKTTTFFRQQAARGSCKSLLSDHGIKAVMFYMLALSPTLISRSDSKREFLDWWGINSTAMPTEFYDFVAKHKETLSMACSVRCSHRQR